MEDQIDDFEVIFDSIAEEHGYDLNEIIFIEGLLFLSMIPLHQDQPQRQLAMYLICLQILNNVL